ncbi:MAG: hypothetical protein JNM22_12260 [Saprospiraceae bacterium]|nr:hypothetical protein [Saprospiraceae bacterium]
MKTISPCRQKSSALLTTVALPLALVFSPLAGIAQTHFSAADSNLDIHEGKSELSNLLGQLEYSALLFLLGAAALAGIVWISYVLRTCADLNKNTRNTRGHFLFLLAMLAGMGIAGSGCSSTQLARAAEMRAAQAAESSNCICQSAAPNNLYYGMSGMYNLTSYYTNSNAFSRPVCKRCGRPVTNRSH